MPIVEPPEAALAPQPEVEHETRSVAGAQSGVLTEQAETLRLVNHWFSDTGRQRPQTWNLGGLVLLQGDLVCTGQSSPNSFGLHPVAYGLDPKLTMTFMFVSAAARANSSPRSVAIFQGDGGRACARFLSKNPPTVLKLSGAAVLPHCLADPVQRYPIELQDGIRMKGGEGACFIWQSSLACFSGVLEEHEYTGHVVLFKLPQTCAPMQKEMLPAALGSGHACIAAYPDGRVVLQVSKSQTACLCLSGLRWSLGRGIPVIGQAKPQKPSLPSLQYLMEKDPQVPAFSRADSIAIGTGAVSADGGKVAALVPEGCRPLQLYTTCVLGPGGPTWIEVDTKGNMRCDPAVTGDLFLTGVVFLVDDTGHGHKQQGSVPQATSRSYSSGQNARPWTSRASSRPGRRRARPRSCRIHPSLEDEASEFNQNLSEPALKEVDEIRQFFQRHETQQKECITHTTFLGTRDTFCSTGKWVFPDDEETQGQLFKHIARLLDLGIPMFIAERFSDCHPWAEDIDIVSDCGNSGDPAPTELVLDRQGLFLVHRARVLFELFPRLVEAKLFIYNSSGWSSNKNAHKVSFHLVWPEIIVNAENATIIRDRTLEVFTDLCRDGGPLQPLMQEIRMHTSAYFQNRFGCDPGDFDIWEDIFDDNSVRPKTGMRLPFNFKATMVSHSPIRHNIDKRSPKPHGVMTFQRDQLTRCPPLHEPDFTHEQWLRYGSVRRQQPDITSMDGSDDSCSSESMPFPCNSSTVSASTFDDAASTSDGCELGADRKSVV